jgi:succinate dehydrogenase / fumarate reductase flavoprotein subunit
MAENLKHDVLILGAGLAGLRAAVEISRRTQGKANIGIVSKVQLMRAHSVCAEGGTGAVLRTDEGDSIELHAWDTVKGSDFLADQDVVFRFVNTSPKEILQLDHWGIPWTRDEHGRIEQRPFGGHSYPRATLAADKTGFFEMQTLYDTLQKYSKSFTRYDEFFVTDILVEDNRFAGLVGIHAPSGETVTLQGKALLIASGGAGTLYGFTTYSQTVTGDGLAMAYRAGVPLEDMEFIQFHPTGLVPSGILMTEGCRGEGGYLKNANGDRFMENYAPEKMELGPRDLVSRAEMTEILEGRGFEGPEGKDYLHLDLTHLGADRINSRLPLIREVAMKFVGIDPIHKPIPIRPVAHYSMGGIETDIDGATRVEGIWAAGEAACVSMHGANRLGSNSTAECLVWGGIAGGEIAKKLNDMPSAPPLPENKVKAAKDHIDDFLKRDGDENLYELRKELRAKMDSNVAVFRTGEKLQDALDTIREIKKRFKKAPVADKSPSYNSNLFHALELENLLDLADVAVSGALAREESRGAHARRDFTTRNDEDWLKHTLGICKEDVPLLDYKTVTINTWKPVERKY